MSTFIIGLLTLVMIAISAMLILLVLVQLPKKDAGAGLAFGSGAADALFGAGSGNALTKITKYAVIAFLVLAWFLGFLWDKSSGTAAAGSFAAQVAQQPHPTVSQAPTTTTPPAQTPATLPPPTMPTGVPTMPSLTNAVMGTNSTK